MFKRLSNFVIIVFFTFMFNITASAVNITDLPVVYDETLNEPVVYTLNKNVNFKVNFTIEKENIVVIPKGKRITIKSNKTFTVKGGLFIEEGGSLIINSGKLVIHNGASVISYGNTYIKKNGKIEIKKGGFFITAESGLLKETGSIAYTDASDFICLGQYTGKNDCVTEILYAVVSVNSYDGIETLDIYCKAEATELFPDSITISEDQDNLAGGFLTKVYFLCENDLVFQISFNGIGMSSVGGIGGIRFKL